MSETDKIMMMHNTEAEQEVIAACVAYVKEHPKWQLSLQQQKILNVR